MDLLKYWWNDLSMGIVITLLKDNTNLRFYDVPFYSTVHLYIRFHLCRRKLWNRN